MFGSPGAPKIFFTRRLIRIVPIYWLLSGLALILTIAVPQAFATGRLLELPYLLGDFAFIPWPNSQGSFERLLVVGWTLDYEMYFYVLFSLALFLRSGLKWLIGFLLASVIAGLFSHPAHPWLQLLMSPMLGEFLLGIFVAQLVRHPVSRWAAWTLLVLGCVAVACSGLWRVDRAFEWGIPAAVIVLAVLWLNIECRGPVGRAMVVLGDASYSIYLTQVFSLPALVIVMKMVGLRLPASRSGGPSRSGSPNG
jgi:peptidoglycan/LPS O-acetylase OafA/YrhL